MEKFQLCLDIFRVYVSNIRDIIQTKSVGITTFGRKMSQPPKFNFLLVRSVIYHFIRFVNTIHEVSGGVKSGAYSRRIKGWSNFNPVQLNI